MPKAKRPGQLLPVDAGREPGLERWRGQAGGADVAVRTGGGNGMNRVCGMDGI